MGNVEIKELGSLRFVHLEHTGYPYEHERMSKDIDGFISKMNLKPYGSRMIMIFDEPEAVPIDRWRTAVGRGMVGLVEDSEPFKVRDFSGLTSLGVEHEGTIEDLVRTYEQLKERATSEGRGIQSFWRVVFKRSRGAEGTIIPQTLVQLFVGKCS